MRSEEFKKGKKKNKNKSEKEEVINKKNIDADNFVLEEKTIEDKTKDNRKTKNLLISIIIVLILVIIAIMGLGVVTYIKKVEKDKKPFDPIVKESVLEDKIKIIDTKSKTRPYAVMIDNVEEALDQFGVNSAQVIYEMPVEYGISRLIAIFKDVNVDKIGPLRSVRHYCIDYAQEYDAILVHEGQSPRGQSEIRTRDIDSVVYTQGLFVRDHSRYAPHNAITSTKRIKNAIKINDFKTETKKKFPFQYTSLRS